MQPYPNPPIKEALIDIKVDPLPASALATLAGLHSHILPRYPMKKERHQWEGRFEVKENQTMSAHKDLGIQGYIFTSEDEQQVVQFRLDGFTFNQLRPYPRDGWPVVRQEAIRLWEVYLSAPLPMRVARIGLRYINEINIPLPNVDLEEYLTEPPRIPSSLPQSLDYFLTRLVIPFPELQAKAIITQSLGQPGHVLPSVSILLDIDVLTNVSAEANSPKVWEIIDRFRDVKNKIFKSSIRPKTEELFK